MWQVDCSHACIEESSYVLSAAESHFSLERVLQRCRKIMCPKLIYSFELQKFKHAFVKPEMHCGGVVRIRRFIKLRIVRVCVCRQKLQRILFRIQNHENYFIFFTVPACKKK
jgi:hypothetical protein